MPQYEYNCACGKQFEKIMSIEDRYMVQCECGEVPKLVMSKCGFILIAGYDTTIGHDGTVLSRKQSTEQTPFLPEKVHGSRW